MLTLDDEDYELLGYGQSHTEAIGNELVAFLIFERLRKREVMRAYRATLEGRQATRESTRAYLKTDKGREMASRRNKKYRLKHYVPRSGLTEAELEVLRRKGREAQARWRAKRKAQGK